MNADLKYSPNQNLKDSCIYPIVDKNDLNFSVNALAQALDSSNTLDLLVFNYGIFLMAGK